MKTGALATFTVLRLLSEKRPRGWGIQVPCFPESDSESIAIVCEETAFLLWRVSA